MMDYDEENSDQEEHTSTKSVEESEIKNNGSSDNLDPLTEAFNSYHNLQQVLEKELEKFQELGKETVSLLHGGGESSSCTHMGHDRAGEHTGEKRLTSLDSEVLNLVKNVEHLEIKLEETKRTLDVKESQIRELESAISVSETGPEMEIGMEDIFQKRMEAEIEYLTFSGSVETLKRKMKLVEEEKVVAENEAHKTLSKLEEARTKAENLKHQAQDLQNHCVDITEIQEVKSFKKRAVKTTSCLLLQLGLLFMLFNIKLMPESEMVVPT